MNLLLNTINFIVAAGLSGLWDTILKNWIGPIFIAAVAIFAIVFIKDRAWMKLLSFVGIAAVVGVLVFAGSTLFGSEGTTKKLIEKEAKKIDTATVVVSPLAGLPTLDN